MRLADVILAVLQASLALLIFGAALQVKPGGMSYLLRHPMLLVRSVLAMNILMPLLALWMALAFQLEPAVRLALVGMSLAPLPPFFPGKLLKAGVGSSYALSLVVLAALLALITIPLSMRALSAFFGLPFAISSAAVFGMIGGSMLLPLGVGAGVRRLWPTLADRLIAPANRVAMLLLVVGVIPLFVRAWPAMKGLLGNGTLLAILTLTFIGLTIGHLLGGPVAKDRPVLALACASRHPVVALTIVRVAAPSAPLVPAAVLLYLTVVVVVSGPYLSWATHRANAPRRSLLAREPKRRAHGGGSLGLHYRRRQDRDS